MVVPVLVTGARIAAGQAVKSTARRQSRRDLRSINRTTKDSLVRARKARASVQTNNQFDTNGEQPVVTQNTTQLADAPYATQKTSGGIPKIKKATGRLTQIRFIGSLAWLSVFALFQFVSVIISIVGYGMEETSEEFLWGITSGFVPGETIFFIFWGIAAIISLSCLAAGVFIGLSQRIKCFKADSLTYFTLAIIFSLVPVLQAVPWVYWWAWKVSGEQ